MLFYFHVIMNIAKVTLLYLTMIGYVDAEEFNVGSISFTLDNDGLVGSDRGYTSGLFLQFNTPSIVDINKSSPFLLNTLEHWLPFQKKSNKNWGLTLGQQLWTPADLSSLVEIEHDRPYVGFLFFESHITEFSSSIANKYRLMLGTVGPNAYGEYAQKSAHSVIGSPKPVGWDRQVNNKVVFNFSYQGQRLLYRSKNISDKNYDAALSGRLNIGNFQNEMALGAVIRWGNNLHKDFASIEAMPGKYFDASTLSKSRLGQFYYLALEGRYRFQDITIDGKRPHHLFDVSIEHWQATISTGIIYYQASWGIASSLAVNSPDYKEDLHQYSATGSLEVFWRI